MRNSRVREEQMVRIVREADNTPVEAIAKKRGVSAPTLYAWKRKFGGMAVHDAKKRNRTGIGAVRERALWC